MPQGSFRYHLGTNTNRFWSTAFVFELAISFFCSRPSKGPSPISSRLSLQFRWSFPWYFIIVYENVPPENMQFTHLTMQEGAKGKKNLYTNKMTNHNHAEMYGLAQSPFTPLWSYVNSSTTWHLIQCRMYQTINVQNSPETAFKTISC